MRDGRPSQNQQPHVILMATVTHFLEGDTLANAQIMLEACREEAERAGDVGSAQILKGLDVASHASAQIALDSMSLCAPKPEVKEVWRVTLRALEHVVAAKRAAS